MTSSAEMVTEIEHVRSLGSARKPIIKNLKTLSAPRNASYILVSAQEEQINLTEGTVN